MYDTVLLCLTQADVSGVNFLEVVPRFWCVLSVAGVCCRLPRWCDAVQEASTGRAGFMPFFFSREEVFSRECVIFAVPKC